MRLVAFVIIGVLALVAATHAQSPRLDEVLRRLDAYLLEYGERLATVVAEETYRQEVPAQPGTIVSRTLRSDFALVRTSNQIWIGYRDTFEVDGRPVRDREDRLMQLLMSGGFGQAARIAEQNARFNLANDLLPRTVNLPTLALDLLHPRYRERFRVRRLTDGVDLTERRWLLEFRERDRPTIVRTPDRRDQPSRVEALVDPATGEVLRTTVSWEKVNGSITVTFDRVANIPVPVPVTMSEQFTTRNEQVIRGDARYSDYRRFQTSGRVVP